MKQNGNICRARQNPIRQRRIPIKKIENNLVPRRRKEHEIFSKPIEREKQKDRN